MDITNENIILLVSILLFVSIIASKTSGKIGIPSLVLFLAVGILAGSEGIGNIEFDDPLSAQNHRHSSIDLNTFFRWP